MTAEKGLEPLQGQESLANSVAKQTSAANLRNLCGGGGGIRTHERRKPLPVFKTGAFNRSATPPAFILASRGRIFGHILPSSGKMLNGQALRAVVNGPHAEAFLPLGYPHTAGYRLTFDRVLSNSTSHSRTRGLRSGGSFATQLAARNV